MATLRNTFSNRNGNQEGTRAGRTVRIFGATTPAAPTHIGFGRLAEVVKGLQKRKRNVWVFANNHFEGCAPLTIDWLKQRIGG